MTSEVSSEAGAPTAADPVEEKVAAAADCDEKETEVDTKVVADVEEKKMSEPLSSDPPSVEKCSSFREESNFLSDLKEAEKKALIELRAKVEEAIFEGKLLHEKQEEQKPKEKKEVTKEKQKTDPETREGGEGETAKLDQAKEKKEEVTEKEKADHEAQRGGEGEQAKLDQGKEEEEVNEKECGEGEKAIHRQAKEEEEKEKVDPETQEEGEGEKAKVDQTADVKAEEKAAPLEEKAIATAASEAKNVGDSDKEATLWGVPLLPSKGSERADVILLKFLRARDFKVKDAFEMLQNVLVWRKQSRIDSILDEESLGADFVAACYMDGVDRERHPVCYNMPGVFQDDKLYQETFGSEQGREKFQRWRVQLMEKGIKALDFTPAGVASLLQITDLNNSPGPSKKELRTTMKQVVQLLQDNYPELVARNIFINVPFWYYAFHALISPFLTQRTRSKFVFARPAKVAETLLRYIPAEAVPVRYGGLKRDDDTEFLAEDGGVSEVIVKSNSTETIEIPAPEGGTTLFWDLSVLGWEVSYKEEFVPTDEGSYTIVVRKSKKMAAAELPVRNSFRNSEPGKVLLTIENNSFWKKKALYRYKIKTSC
ncbi:hypothetical protein OPV22_032585 [Ensete ventricosum]|uniref:CRAL-TRIO domain-containing protein n=1 Tax=Ensete ventricosum TaxID=4639 RepID=A0AAV8PZN9_ENSVE|nr:hypothetical protein OPV22_032585 [Ensete ventricosum]RZR77928.1 hypothetical protein BHM03_00003136 [Ensete ventricosum]